MATVQTVKNQIATRTIRPMSPAVAEVRTNINLMVEVMKSCMVKDMHYGVIPGVDKPSLFKAGAEKLMATFRLSANPVVEDLSKDGEIRFRVKVEINAKDGSFVGAGIGECSSQEEKYMWRVAVCQEEFDITDETKRRIKFKKKYNGPVDKINQVRCNPSDLANTILKMAKKRALVDGVLTATGASDLFSQDIEDLPAEYVESVTKTHITPEHITQEPQKQPETQVKATNAPTVEEAVSEFNGTPLNESLSGLGVACEVPEFQGLIKSIKTRDINKKNGEIGQITEYVVEDSAGEQFTIAKWGKAKTGLEVESLATFLIVRREEDYNGKKKFKASEIVVSA